MPVSAASTKPPETPLPVSCGSSTSSGISTNQSDPSTISSAQNKRRKSRLRVTTVNVAATHETLPVEAGPACPAGPAVD